MSIIKNTSEYFIQKFNCTICDTTLETIVNHGYEQIKKELEGTNIEINRDKKAVIDRINYLMFDKKYQVFLDELDNYLNTSSSIVSSGMVGNMRSFMEDILTDLAKKYPVC